MNLLNRNSTGMNHIMERLPRILHCICSLHALCGRFIDWLGTKKGYLWAIGIWSAGACLHALCGVATEAHVGLHSAAELAGATGDVVVIIATVSMYCFLADDACWLWVKPETSRQLSK